MQLENYCLISVLSLIMDCHTYVFDWLIIIFFNTVTVHDDRGA